MRSIHLTRILGPLGVGLAFLLLPAASCLAVEPLVLPINLPGTNIPAGARIECLVSHVTPAPVLAVGFSPNGKLLASSGYHEVLLWDLENATLAKRIATPGERVRSLAWSTNSATLFFIDGTPGISGALRAVDVGTDKVTTIGEEAKDELIRIALNAGNKLLAASAADGTIRIFSVPDYKLVTTLHEHTDRVTALDFSPDDEHLLGAGADRLAVVWNIADWKAIQRLTQPDPIQAAAFSPEGDLIAFAMASTTDPCVRVTRFNPEISTNTPARPRAKRAQNNQAATRVLDCDTSQPQCILWSTNAFRANFPRRGNIANRRILYIYAACDSAVKIFNWNADLAGTLSGQTDWICSAAFDADQSRLAAGCADGTIRIWNTFGDRLVATLVTTRQPDGWAIVTARGMFSASAPDLLDWRTTNFTPPAQMLRRRLERPERVAAIITGLPVRPGGKESLEPNE